MYKEKKITVIIVAAGSGRRMGEGIQKQYIMLNGMPVLARSVAAYDGHPLVDEIIVVIKADEETLFRQEILDVYKFQKISQIVAGGKTRQDSVYNACKKVSDDAAYILVHDGARPFVSRESITELIETIVEKGSAIVAVPVKDTIKVAAEGEVLDSPDRSRLFAAQTPQGSRKDLLLEALEKAYQDGFYGTDEAVLLARTGQKVYIVNGDDRNMKITTPADIPVGRLIAGSEVNTMRTGIGYDVHRFCNERPLILGGITIPFDKGLLGHSDADVLTHAIMDALLGACGLGDLGRHFPDSNPQYKGISSMELLKKVGMILSDNGFSIGNIDAVVIAEKPKIAAYVSAMAKEIAAMLHMDANRINIKATTTEKLGFTGREEGIAVQAIASVFNRNSL